MVAPARSFLHAGSGPTRSPVPSPPCWCTRHALASTCSPIFWDAPGLRPPQSCAPPRRLRLRPFATCSMPLLHTPTPPPSTLPPPYLSHPEHRSPAGCDSLHCNNRSTILCCLPARCLHKICSPVELTCPANYRWCDSIAKSTARMKSQSTRGITVSHAPTHGPAAAGGRRWCSAGVALPEAFVAAASGRREEVKGRKGGSGGRGMESGCFNAARKGRSGGGGPAQRKIQVRNWVGRGAEEKRARKEARER